MAQFVSQRIISKILFQPHRVEVCPKPTKTQFFTHNVSAFTECFSSFRVVLTQKLFDNPARIRLYSLQPLRNIHRAPSG